MKAIGRGLTSLGVYVPNNFLIELRQNTPFLCLDDSGNPFQDNKFLPIFVHEYWHYWHNISTISGVKSYSFSQKLISEFSHTLVANADGTSIGSRSTDREFQVGPLLRLRTSHEGSRGPDGWIDDNTIDFTVRGFGGFGDEQILDERTAPNPRVLVDTSITWPDGGSPKDESFLVGSLAIEESVAAAIHEVIHREIYGNNIPVFPPFPYQIVKRILESKAPGLSVSPATIASLGTLALLTPFPGEAICHFALDIGDANSRGDSEESVIAASVEWLQPQLIDYVQNAIDNDLLEIEIAQEGRGLIEFSTRFICEQLRNNLRRRLDDPLFDLEPFFPEFSLEKFVSFQAANPPCDVNQEMPGSADLPERDILCSLTEWEPNRAGFRPTDFLRAQQAQQHYVFSHLDVPSGQFRNTNEVTNRMCPFYAGCRLSARKEDPATCKNAPWRCLTGSRLGCWYRVAVESTVGRVKVISGSSEAE